MVFYFAYGANMDEDVMKQRGAAFRKKLPGVLPGWRIVFNVISDLSRGTGYANIVPEGGSRAEGIIYDTSAKAISTLDVFEDYPHDYVKRSVVVIGRDGKEYRCIAYVANPVRTSAGLRPAREYLEHLLRAFPLLSPEYARFLRETETAD
jgi:gamma-glutamylcyclotransferase (GGCT)/AIG2-like uncharacterized protein YtfP